MAAGVTNGRPARRTGGQAVVEALEAAGVGCCFGVPGESYLGVLDALHDSDVRFVSARHEGGASFMASGYAKASGRVGVCLGTRAVGAANLAIGVHAARQDSTPLLALVGQVNRSFAGREAFQEVDLVAAMAPFAKWAVQLPDADRAPELMARALHLATAGRPGPVVVAIPQDVCDEPTGSPAIAVPPVARPRPDPAAVAAAVDALLGAARPLLFAGGGLAPHDGFGALVALAEAAEVPVVTSWRRHDRFPNDHRLFLGSAGLGAPATVWERVAEADVLVVLGSRLQENGTDGYRVPAAGTRLVHVDIDPAAAVRHRSAALVVQADAAATVDALLAALPRPVPGVAGRRGRNDADRARYEAATALPPVAPGEGVSYQAVVRALDEVLPPEALLVSDAGNFYGWLARYHRFRRPGTYIGPTSGAMGYGLPAAIGAKLARPGVPVVSLSGDGGFLMTVAELDTAAREGVPVVAMVLDNARHGTIRMHQERLHPGRELGTELAPTDLALVARGLGGAGCVVEHDDEVGDALRDALREGAPVVVHLRMDRAALSVERRLGAPPA